MTRLTASKANKADAHRSQLSEFLKNCRSRVKPDDLGLPSTKRRRTPGLRREDVAALAGVSVTWYTWLEQGRDIQVSTKVLDQIAETLQMSADERDYLYALAQRRPAPPIPANGVKASDTLQRMVNALGCPALVMTERWHVIAWNEINSRVFFDFTKLPPEKRNLFRILMLNEDYPQDSKAYDFTVKNIVPKFRVDFSQTADVEGFQELIDELSQTCEAFREHWNSPELAFKSEGINEEMHPELGSIKYEFSSYIPEGQPTLRVLIHVPYDPETAEKFGALQQSIAS